MGNNRGQRDGGKDKREDYALSSVLFQVASRMQADSGIGGRQRESIESLLREQEDLWWPVVGQVTGRFLMRKKS